MSTVVKWIKIISKFEIYLNIIYFEFFEWKMWITLLFLWRTLRKWNKFPDCAECFQNVLQNLAWKRTRRSHLTVWRLFQPRCLILAHSSTMLLPPALPPYPSSYPPSYPLPAPTPPPWWVAIPQPPPIPYRCLHKLPPTNVGGMDARANCGACDLNIKQHGFCWTHTEIFSKSY